MEKLRENVGLILAKYRRYPCLAGRMAMHACKIGSTDTAPPCLESPDRACVGTRRMLWGRESFCPHFSSATEVRGWCDYTVPLFRILGLGVILAARCLWSRPAWTFFFFLPCSVDNSKHGGGARCGIGCCVVVVAIGRLCRSCAISILQRYNIRDIVGEFYGSFIWKMKKFWSNCSKILG